MRSEAVDFKTWRFLEISIHLRYCILLRRSGLINVDWSKRTIEREKSLSEYAKKSIIGSPMWPSIGEDWRKINNILLNKHGAVNTEFQQLLPKQ